jgi:hypothetical protein
VYIATKLADRARDTTWRGGRLVSSRERAQALRIVREHAAAAPADVRAARVLVDSVWRGTPPGTGVLANRWPNAGFMTTLLVVSTAVLALAIALLLRRGPVLRLFGVELITRDGRRASRLRVLTRQGLVWLPAVVAIGLWAGSLARVVADGATFSPGHAAFAGIPMLWSAWLWLTVRTPTRSPADRLAGTYLVPQ